VARVKKWKRSSFASPELLNCMVRCTGYEAICHEAVARHFGKSDRLKRRCVPWGETGGYRPWRRAPPLIGLSMSEMHWGPSHSN
jgi:hypothetical protein